jgi:hypothetical protein
LSLRHLRHAPFLPVSHAHQVASFCLFGIASGFKLLHDLGFRGVGFIAVLTWTQSLVSHRWKGFQFEMALEQDWL